MQNQLVGRVCVLHQLFRCTRLNRRVASPGTPHSVVATRSSAARRNTEQVKNSLVVVLGKICLRLLTRWRNPEEGGECKGESMLWPMCRVSLSKTLDSLSTQESVGTCEGRVVCCVRLAITCQNGSNWAVYSPGSWDGFRNVLWARWAGVTNLFSVYVALQGILFRIIIIIMNT